MVRGPAAYGGDAGVSGEAFVAPALRCRVVIVRVGWSIGNGTVGLEPNAKVGLRAQESGEEWVGALAAGVDV